jgi:hypothetical protein
MELDDKNHGVYSTSGFGDRLSKVVVVVSGVTPFTWELADYSYKVH